MSDGLAGQALWYGEEQGWPVLPVVEGGKVPLISRWPEAATADTNKLLWWWAQWPDANVGLATGHAFDVLDVDDLEKFNQAVPANAPFPKGPYVLTGSGGVHFYFRATGLGNRVAFMPGADWRGKGGFVVAPPSLHPNGQPYRWGIGPTEPIPAVPGWLRDRLQPSGAPDRLRAIQGPMPGRYGRAALRGEARALARAEVGERNDRLNRAAFRLGQLVASGALDAATVRNMLLDVAVGLGLGEAGAEATIGSGLKAGQNCPRQVAS